MNSNTHPIDLFIVLCMEMFEGLCWIINELAGFHTTKDATSPTPTPKTPAQWAGNYNVDEALIDHAEYIMSLNVKQLRKYTGITNSRYRKADLQALALA